MYTFFVYLKDLLSTGGVRSFLAFFVFVWAFWALKVFLASRYRPFTDPEHKTRSLRTTVVSPVFNEPEEIFRAVLESVRANGPSELIVVVDGGDPHLARVARGYADVVLCMPKRGKRSAIQAGFEASDPSTDVVLVLDSDTRWPAGTLRKLLIPFADPRVGAVTPRQGIFDRDRNPVRRLADWIEDLRYHGTVPAQSVFGQVGCLAGRTIAYRRQAFEPAVHRMASQRVLGVEMHVGDDRVLTNEILRAGWRTVYQSTAFVQTDAPNTWRGFWKQQLRWGRSSQRETLLCLPWLWRRPYTLACFLSDIVIPFWLYAILASAVIRALQGAPSPINAPLPAQVALAYAGMISSIGIRQIPHFRRYSRDLRALPIFVLQLTFLMAPTRLAAFATMLHQSWDTRRTPQGREGINEPDHAASGRARGDEKRVLASSDGFIPAEALVTA